MRKCTVLSMLCVCIVFGITGCNSSATNNEAVVKTSEDAVKDTSKDTSADITKNTADSTIDKKSLEAPVATKKSEYKGNNSWDVLAENVYDFSVNDMAFYSEDLAITVGRGGEIHYSSDQGITCPQSDNESHCRFGLDIVNDEICYTCGNNGEVTKSTDGGKTFEKMTSFGTDQGKIISFVDENNGIIATQKSMAITKDGAKTWSPLETPSAVIAVCMETADCFCYIGDDLNLYRTTDCGATWEQTSLNLPEKSDYLNKSKSFAFTIDGSKSYTFYCFQKSTGLLKSYSTTDNCVNYSENDMPEIDVTSYIYVNHPGNIITLYNIKDKSVIALIKK